MRQAIRRWWEGTYIPEPPDSLFLMPFCKRHWTAKVARAIAGFIAKEWKWLAGFSVALFMAVAAYLRLP